MNDLETIAYHAAFHLREWLAENGVQATEAFAEALEAWLLEHLSLKKRLDTTEGE